MKIIVFEKAAELAGYHIEKISNSEKTKNVKKVEGTVPNFRAKVRWDGFGCCFHTKNNARLKNFDLPLKEALEQLKKEGYVC